MQLAAINVRHALGTKKPNQVAPASIRQATEFGEKVMADVFWVKINETEFPILSIIDSATKYQVAALVRSERGDDYVAALERCWIRHFGVPRTLVTDEGRGWLGDEFNSWTSSHGVLQEVAPGEGHQKLALVERRHQVLRKAIDRGLLGRHGSERRHRHQTYKPFATSCPR